MTIDRIRQSHFSGQSFQVIIFFNNYSNCKAMCWAAAWHFTVSHKVKEIASFFLKFITLLSQESFNVRFFCVLNGWGPHAELILYICITWLNIEKESSSHLQAEEITVSFQGIQGNWGAWIWESKSATILSINHPAKSRCTRRTERNQNGHCCEDFWWWHHLFGVWNL